MKKCQIDGPPTAREDILKRGIKEWKGRKMKAVLCKLWWGATVYHLWRHKNDLKFGNRNKTEEKLLQSIRDKR